MNIDQYELNDLPMKQSGDSLHEHTGVGMAPREGSSTKLHWAVDPC